MSYGASGYLECKVTVSGLMIMTMFRSLTPYLAIYCATKPQQALVNETIAQLSIETSEFTGYV